jgi:hypothetical protein
MKFWGIRRSERGMIALDMRVRRGRQVAGLETFRTFLKRLGMYSVGRSLRISLEAVVGVVDREFVVARICVAM